MRARVGLFLASLLVACSTLDPPGPIPLVGKFHDFNETVTGEIRPISEERSFVTVRTVSGLYCEGFTQRTSEPLLTICEDEIGIAILNCGGGRRLTADWRASSCTSGEGTGSDNTGARFSFAYGLPEADAQQYLATAKAELAAKPGLEQGSRSPGGTGTGFLISSDGLVATNHHVIDGANTIEVHYGNTIYRASVVAQDRANDIAILKTDMKGQPLSLASARTSMRGDEVLTLGYPLSTLAGETQKATFGRINATAGLNDDARYLQIDIPIQPGNSGGPLLNKRGEVIGVVSASINDEFVFRRTGAVPQNVNYAVKADYITVLLPSGAQVAATALPQDAELPALVGMAENSVFRIVAKP